MQSRVNELLEEYWVRSGQGTRKTFRRDQLQRLEDLFDRRVYESFQRYKKELAGMVKEPKKLTTTDLDTLKLLPVKPRKKKATGKKPKS